MSDHTRRPPEPEIIPPGTPEPKWQQRRRDGSAGQAWVWTSDQRGTRLRYTHPGPLGLILIFATLAALGALGFFVFVGALAIMIPIVAALVLAGLIGGILRRL